MNIYCNLIQFIFCVFGGRGVSCTLLIAGVTFSLWTGIQSHSPANSSIIDWTRSADCVYPLRDFGSLICSTGNNNTIMYRLTVYRGGTHHYEASVNYFRCHEKLSNDALICVTGVESPCPPTQFIQSDYFGALNGQDSILGKWLLNCYNYCVSGKRRSCAVGIATGYGLHDQEVGFRVQVGERIFTSPCRPDRLWGLHSHLSNRYWTLSSGVKRPQLTSS
jgi:hypothetical protein